MFLVKTPALLRWLMPQLQWRVHTSEKVLYLTFDDGPIPELTPWVLDQLRAYGAKATFFCVGDNVRKHPELYAQVLAEGHRTANHTFHHLNGSRTPDAVYWENVQQCATWVNSRLFRPPYGRLRPAQRRRLLQAGYTIVMWDVLSGDFSAKLSPEQCRDGVLRHAGPGSIVVFHDNIKATANLQVALPATLAYFSDKGYRFETLKA
jgi:peptidoglycan-N-acetylglucosamine deacetylase